jgi:hypothetical protein
VELEVLVVGKVGAAERVAVEVVDRDDLVRVDQPARQRRADETGAAGHQHAFPGERHAADLSVRSARGGQDPG